VLGLKFNNGKLVTWSPYYDLSSKARSDESETLPFPTGKVLRVIDSVQRIPFDVIEKDYETINTTTGFAVVDNNGNMIKANQVGENEYELEVFLNDEGLS
jgi:hypothetical protein